MSGDALYGVLQVINNRSNQPFTKLDKYRAQQLCDTLGIAIRQHMQKIGDSKRKKPLDMMAWWPDGVLSQDELSDCI